MKRVLTWTAVWTLIACGAWSTAVWAADEPSVVLLEAEQFDSWGGWCHDTQFMHVMGSPYLLAHGLGEPVEDAVTEVTFPKPGTYRVWVRTRDWVATWNAPGAPGRFQVLVDGKPLDTVFGIEGAEWHWQDGGTIRVDPDKRSLEVRLHDLTGFEGRCDAIVFTADLENPPPNDETLDAWRRKVLGLPAVSKECGPFDLVVVGGGMSGTCAAVSAARLGLKVALIQDRRVLGGNNSSEVRVWLNGAINCEPYPRIGDVVAELDPVKRAHNGPGNTGEIYEDDRRLALVKAEPNLTLLTGYRAYDVETKDGRITAVLAQDTVSAERIRCLGTWFADCTGDGTIGAAAGADFEMTLPGHMGCTNLWWVYDTGKPVSFPRCPWALDLTEKPFPGRQVSIGDVPADKRGTDALGCWFWESGFDHDPILKGEYIRDWNFRAMYGAWDALKNVDKTYPTYKIGWAAYIAGPRESRRLMGDVVLTKEDILSGREFPDGCVPTGWSIDIHVPDPRYNKGFEGDAFISKANFTHYPTPYWIPYRCLYSRNIPNLFMAGRCISVTHEALGTVRVMRTCGCMGEIVGMAASLCKKFDTSPRGVYQAHLEDLKALMRKGVGRRTEKVAKYLQSAEKVAALGENLAPKAAISTSESYAADKNPPERINDGKIDLLDNGGRWLSAAKLPAVVELTFDTPQRLTAARLVSGYLEPGDRVGSVVEAFRLQWFDGSEWHDWGEPVEGNQDVDRLIDLPTVTARRVRLEVTASPGNIARIWEFSVFGEK
ncbi:MAG: FAD-dependent oxidoreductase [Planctomycetota bacterium]|nr:MAG: FAD-dependent oxidoreductase [Planctomycetota bacterium]